eukprot:Em0399g3a
MELTLFLLALGIRVVLAQVITWTNGDCIISATSPSVLLDNFSGYKPNVTVRYNAALLFTSNLAVGVVRDYSSAVSVSSTASHELGHILNMVHDTGSCQCNDTNGCIMTQEIGSQPPNQWSSCSVKSLVVGLDKFRSCMYKQNGQTIQKVQVSTNAIEQSTPTFATFSPPLVQPSTPEPTAALKSTDVIATASHTISGNVAVAGVLKPITDQAVPSIKPSTTTANSMALPTMLNSPTSATFLGVLLSPTRRLLQHVGMESAKTTKFAILCKNPCCDPATCQLVKERNATAASAVSGATLHVPASCGRASTVECDVAEYCTGSSRLTAHRARLSGTAPRVQRVQPTCYNGSCPTRDSQCRPVWLK